MGSIRKRKENGKLFIDFTVYGQRCREQTLLEDTASNRKRLEQVLKKIEESLLSGTFVYSDFFPNSKKAALFNYSNEVVDSAMNTKQKPAMRKIDTPLFQDFQKQWFDEMSIGWRISYKETVTGILDGRLIKNFGEKQVSDITKADILQFRASLAKVERNGKPLSASHINRHIKLLYMIINEAADRFDFIAPTKIKPLKLKKTHIQPFSMNEVKLILSNVRNDYKNYFTVRFFTGMRTGEVDGLKWKYVDFDNREILIRETIIDQRIEYTKNDSSQRNIQMSQPVYVALKKQFEVTGHRSEYVFANRNGNPLNHRNVTKRVWYPLLRYLNLDRRNPYQMRHTCATLWLASGETPEWIAQQLGHTTTTMLFTTYSRYVPNLTRQDGSAFDNLLAQNQIVIDSNQGGDSHG